MNNKIITIMMAAAIVIMAICRPSAQPAMAMQETSASIIVYMVVVIAHKPIPPPVVESESKLESLGVFKLYAYCPCVKCCGKSDGITKSGTVAEQGRTIAVDSDIITLGSRVVIDGLGEFIAEDTGNGITGQTIDVYMDDHQAALTFGIQYAEVWIAEKP